MKLKTLKTYQAVRFNTKDETHFDHRIPRFEGIDMDFKPEYGYVQVTLPGKDSILIFTANIAYAVLTENAVAIKKVAKG